MRDSEQDEHTTGAAEQGLRVTHSMGFGSSISCEYQMTVPVWAIKDVSISHYVTEGPA